MTILRSIAQLEEIYPTPAEASTAKEIDHISDAYRALIEASPFLALATVGPEGLDCSPRGELGGVVEIKDRKTLLLPDRRGNNRVDSLRNIVRDPRVALLFLIPGSGTTLRINGTAEVSIAPDLLKSLAVEGKEPRSVIVITVVTVYFQCARAIVRSDLWNPARHTKPGTLPTPGDILADLTRARIGGKAYDDEWPERAAKSLW